MLAVGELLLPSKVGMLCNMYCTWCCCKMQAADLQAIYAVTVLKVCYEDTTPILLAQEYPVSWLGAVAATPIDAPMQNSMRGQGAEAHEQQLRLLAELASGHLGTFHSQASTLAAAFDTIVLMEDGPPVLLPSLFLDAFSIKIIRALASASSRVLQVIVPLSSSGASSSNTRIGSRLYQHQQALMSVIMCVTLYTGYMEMYYVR
jgi:hypothetical protein